MDKQVFAGKFEIQKELARGTTGTIYYGYDLDLRREVVIKTYHSHINGRLVRGKSFIEKTQSILKLEHPNLIKIFKVEEDNETPIIFMEFFDGTSLENRLHEKGPLPFESMLLLARGIAEGLVHLHFQGIIHGTLDPGHVLVGPQQEIKVTDLGLTRILLEALPDSEADLLRPLPYLPPESAKGEPLSFSSDLYCFGFMMYEMLTQTTPYSNLPKTSIMGKLAFDQSDPPFDFPDSVPQAIQDLIRQMTRNKAKNRLQDTTHVLTIINQKLGKLSPVEVHTLPVPETPQPNSPSPPSGDKEPSPPPEPAVASKEKEIEQVPASQAESPQEPLLEQEPPAEPAKGESKNSPRAAWPGKWGVILGIIVFIGGASAGYWFRELIDDSNPVSPTAIPAPTSENNFRNPLSTGIPGETPSTGLEHSGSLTNEVIPSFPENRQPQDLQSNSFQEPSSSAPSAEKKVPEPAAIPLSKKSNKPSNSPEKDSNHSQSPSGSSANSSKTARNDQKETSNSSKDPLTQQEPQAQQMEPSNPVNKPETAAPPLPAPSKETGLIPSPATQELLNSVDSTEGIDPASSLPQQP